ncbi:MAG: hydantoinase B/oxoprolinase family protein [Burkholderiales bacterium]|nr:hydantoinase B/oxoprolinase family protein [Burkholderiales bacterium]
MSTARGRNAIAMKIDPIAVEVIGNHFRCMTDEMGVTLVKSAYSTNIKERRDCSAGLLDARGGTIALTAYTTSHIGSMLGLQDQIFQHCPLSTIEPGDIYMANDPFSGGPTHLPDITLTAPYFHKGKLVFFLASVGHHTEVGGGLGSATDIWSEGLRIPIIKLFSRGELREDIFNLILLNVRNPTERRGDLEAQIAALKLGQRRLDELFSRYSEREVLGCSRILFDQAERRIRASIAALPDGRYEFEDFMDDDGVDAEHIPIRCAITIAGEDIELDFTGSAPQVKGSINMTSYSLKSAVYYTLKSALAPDVPPNAGLYRAIKVIAPQASIVNCSPPAAVLNRSDTFARVVEVILGALAPAAPNRVIAACRGANTGIEFRGWREGNRFWSYLETIGGGFGARHGLDGVGGVQTGSTNTSNLPSEVMELEYPVFLERYELLTDSGGPGRWRGGQGVIRSFRIRSDGTTFRTKGDRCKSRPWGLFGGLEGAAGSFALNPGTAEERALPSKSFNVAAKKHDVIAVWVPGSGGYGDPRARERERVVRDVLFGYVSRESAKTDYGVDIDEAELERLARMI